MNTIHEALKAYMHAKTRGLVKLGDKEAADLVLICQGKEPIPAKIIMSMYDNQAKAYVKRQEIVSNDRTIERLTKEHKYLPRIDYFYKWELYRSDGKLLTTLYNLNPSIL